MKKVLVALLTFTVGIVAFNLVKTKQVSNSVNSTVQQKAVIVSEHQIENIPNKKTEILKPFFDSFETDEYIPHEYQGYSGWFIADDFKGMKEVWTILLRIDNENFKKEKLVWSAMILTQHSDYSANDMDNFQSVSIKTENNRLSFRTNRIRSIEYRFNGEFLKSGKNFSEDEKVLNGTLEKIVKGKTVAKFTTDFAYNEPHCFH